MNAWTKSSEPFYWSHGIERITNGRYTLELHTHNFTTHIDPIVAVEMPDGTSVFVHGYSDGSVQWGAFDTNGWTVPQYVRGKAENMIRKYFSETS